jgi:hypothetical protein
MTFDLRCSPSQIKSGFFDVDDAILKFSICIEVQRKQATKQLVLHTKSLQVETKQVIQKTSEIYNLQMLDNLSSFYKLVDLPLIPVLM